MTNNDVLRRLRYIFDIADAKMVNIFALAGAEVSCDQVNGWLKAEEDPDYTNCPDAKLEIFLNGFIVSRRGKKDGPGAVLEKKINNNMVLRKLKIALDYKSKDVLKILALAGLAFSEHELSAMLRRNGHKHYRECKDQFLRNFLEGLRLKYRKE